MRAADKGLDWAQFNLANLMLRGRGVAPDARWALSLYQSAADRGHAKAMNMIGRFCEEGWVVPRNMQAALHWYRCAAEGGDFRGQYNLGSLLLGLGRASEAIVWLEKAVRHGTQDFVSAVSAEMLNSNHRGVRALGALAAARRAAPTISSTDRCTSVPD
jgi:TPR repeat protein